jgi:serine protease Do
MRCNFAFVFLFALTPAVHAPPAAFGERVPETVQDLQAIEAHVQTVVERVMPATVCLRVGNSQGSGVIIDREGHILTAGHVSGRPNQDVTIILADGKRLLGKTLGANSNIDSGMVIITEKADFPFVEMAKSSDLRKGDWCLALGHPGGYKPGRPPVVRLGRLQDVSVKALVSDCALVGGDSGGPLFDLDGKVIGIHSRIGDKVSANVHVPIDTYRKTWDRLAAREVWGAPLALIDKVKLDEAYLGVSPTQEKKTLKIATVTAGSPADKAGLKANDILLRIDKQPLTTIDDLGSILKNRRPGTPITVHVQRGNETLAIAVTLGKR